jgi:hypothetical protein
LHFDHQDTVYPSKHSILMLFKINKIFNNIGVFCLFLICCVFCLTLYLQWLFISATFIYVRFDRSARANVMKKYSPSNFTKASVTHVLMFSMHVVFT